VSREKTASNNEIRWRALAAGEKSDSAVCFWVALLRRVIVIARRRKNSIPPLPLGGAAVHRCDNQFVFSTGFSR
jgi:hypothetical protein